MREPSFDFSGVSLRVVVRVTLITEALRSLRGWARVRLITEALRSLIAAIRGMLMTDALRSLRFGTSSCSETDGENDTIDMRLPCEIGMGCGMSAWASKLLKYDVSSSMSR